MNIFHSDHDIGKTSVLNPVELLNNNFPIIPILIGPGPNGRGRLNIGDLLHHEITRRRLTFEAGGPKKHKFRFVAVDSKLV